MRHLTIYRRRDSSWFQSLVIGPNNAPPEAISLGYNSAR